MARDRTNNRGVIRGYGPIYSLKLKRNAVGELGGKGQRGGRHQSGPVACIEVRVLPVEIFRSNKL